jgi:uncharacterized protein YndB with AHSA1/START domain
MASLGHSTPVTEVRRTIGADPETVWQVLADPTTYPEWLIGAQAIRSVDGGFPTPGTDFHHEVGATEDLTVSDRTTSLDADRPHRLALEVRARPFFVGIVRFRLTPVPEGTELVLAEEPAGVYRLLAPVLRPLVVARNQRSLDKLRDLVESRASTAG